MELGAPELLIILFVVLLLFGPSRIASLGRELGSSIRQFRQGLEEPSEREKPDEEQTPKAE
jgi:sec-independent protein translocase protein TatA